MSKAFPCAAPNCSEIVMKRYFMEQHHTGANFPEMVALALEDLAGQKLLFEQCLKRMCKGKGREGVGEQNLSKRVCSTDSVAELIS